MVRGCANYVKCDGQMGSDGMEGKPFFFLEKLVCIFDGAFLLFLLNIYNLETFAFDSEMRLIYIWTWDRQGATNLGKYISWKGKFSIHSFRVSEQRKNLRSVPCSGLCCFGTGSLIWVNKFCCSGILPVLLVPIPEQKIVFDPCSLNLRSL